MGNTLRMEGMGRKSWHIGWMIGGGGGGGKARSNESVSLRTNETLREGARHWDPCVTSLVTPTYVLAWI